MLIESTLEDAGARLDKFLSAKLPDLSRSRLQALISQGCVTSNDTIINDSNSKVKAGQSYTVTIPEIVPSHLIAQDIALDIVFEDDDMLVLNKPAGLTVHPAPGHPDMTLVNALLAHCGETLSGIGGVARPGIVHRIDKDTSGLLVVAKNDIAHLYLSAQLADHSLQRTYHALVWGAPKTARGTITGNIGRSTANRQKMAVVKSGGKPAVSHYHVRESFHCGLKSPLVSLVECKLETGRTHQIRVHFTHIGNPLVGDQTYGQTTTSRLQGRTPPASVRDALLKFQRQALHAKELVLIHPTTGKEMRFECSLPDDIRHLIEALL
jgi:23S rRNA pseudouridine1911/1915/1917 synthase